jgi:hypothetical protein
MTWQPIIFGNRAANDQLRRVIDRNRFGLVLDRLTVAMNRLLETPLTATPDACQVGVVALLYAANDVLDEMVVRLEHKPVYDAIARAIDAIESPSDESAKRIATRIAAAAPEWEPVTTLHGVASAATYLALTEAIRVSDTFWMKGGR